MSKKKPAQVVHLLGRVLINSRKKVCQSIVTGKSVVLLTDTIDTLTRLVIGRKESDISLLANIIPTY